MSVVVLRSNKHQLTSPQYMICSPYRMSSSASGVCGCIGPLAQPAFGNKFAEHEENLNVPVVNHGCHADGGTAWDDPLPLTILTVIDKVFLRAILADLCDTPGIMRRASLMTAHRYGRCSRSVHFNLDWSMPCRSSINRAYVTG
jgi:hypothetical protein